MHVSLSGPIEEPVLNQAQVILNTCQVLMAACQSVGFAFRDSSARVTTDRLRVLFDDCAVRWLRFSGDVQVEVLRYATIAGDWSGPQTPAPIPFNLDDALASGNEIAILMACQYGQALANNLYLDILKEPLPGNLLRLIFSQQVEIEALHEQLLHVRDRYTASQPLTNTDLHFNG